MITLPKFQINIQSNNSTDNQSAVEGDEVTLVLLVSGFLHYPMSNQWLRNRVIAQGENIFNSVYCKDLMKMGPYIFN